ncbi:MAG: energy-coupling factor ABC transporter permease [Candidatus Helarchaeota archaeon]
MHIPDGLLALWVWIPLLIVSAVFIFYSYFKLKKQLDEKMVPYLGLLSAGIFAAQLFNFPIPGGTSGHLIGGTLIASMFGPYAVPFILFLVLFIQALFGDGGITAIGANLFNMGIIGGMFSYLLIKLLIKLFKKMKDSRKLVLSAGIASFISIILASVAASIEIALSGVIPIEVVLPAMVFWHTIIAIGEGLITSAILYYIIKAKPELIIISEDLGLILIEEEVK